MNENNNSELNTPSIVVENVSFEYSLPGYKPVPALKNLSFQLPHGSITLLLGANGAGKSTLLRVIAGKHLLKENCKVEVLGKSAFYQTLGISGITYLGQNWVKTVAFAGHSVPYQADIEVKNMMRNLQDEFPERRKELYEVLEIDPEWRMHQVSDGQRRRVQIMLGLLRPFKVLLLDEITVDLDVLARRRFLNFLKKECEKNKSTIIYATHIFDGLEDFPTHLLLLEKGELIECSHYNDIKAKETNFKSLYDYVVKFLESMFERRTKTMNTGESKEKKVDMIPSRMMSHFM